MATAVSSNLKCTIKNVDGVDHYIFSANTGHSARDAAADIDFIIDNLPKTPRSEIQIIVSLAGLESPRAPYSAADFLKVLRDRKADFMALIDSVIGIMYDPANKLSEYLDAAAYNFPEFMIYINEAQMVALTGFAGSVYAVTDLAADKETELNLIRGKPTTFLIERTKGGGTTAGWARASKLMPNVRTGVSGIHLGPSDYIAK